MLRTLAVAPLALLLSLLLLYGLALMTAGEAVNPEKMDPVPNFDFHLVRDSSDLNVIKRERPPIPEPVVTQPQQPDMKMMPTPEIEVSTPSIEVPNIATASPVKLAVNLSSVKPVVQMTPQKPTPVKTQPVKTAKVAMKPVDISVQIDMQPVVTKQSPPQYPLKARRKRIEGFVEVEFTVMPSGRVDGSSIRVVDSNPADVFDTAVLRSIKRWRFKIRHSGGEAVSYIARQRMEFKLK